MIQRAAILLLLFAAGCAGPGPQDPPLEYNGEAFHAVDGVIAKLVLEDLLEQAEFHTYPSWKSKPKLAVADTTEGLSHFITTGQLLPELQDRPPVPMELYNQLKARNSRKISLNPIDSPRVQMISRDQIPWGERGFGETLEGKFPEARAYVRMWLPAYSAEGTSALVRFAFSPTPHGACGTYFLERKKGSWTVLWRNFAYYA